MTQTPQPPDGYYPPQQPQGGYPPQPQQSAPGGYPPPQQPAPGAYQQPAPGGYPPPQPAQQGYYQAPQQQYAAPPAGDPDIQQNKVMAILAYFNILVLIPIFAAKESRFARYHANQGLVLFLLEVAYSVVYGVVNAILLTTVLTTGSFGLASIVNLLFGLVALGIFVLFIIGLINAAKGEFKPLPVIGNITILK
ncbi:MAG: hypothetical protein LBC97_06605 [Bifidobacteriaceae bacterium]|jgi:uncharacterized membrane protein|nr:hypothetical protein [Bifidobacteriaceae bacterium]